MALAQYLAELEAFVKEAQQAFASADTSDALESARVQFLGAKSGRIKDAQKGLGAVDTRTPVQKKLNITRAAKGTFFVDGAWCGNPTGTKSALTVDHH